VTDSAEDRKTSYSAEFGLEEVRGLVDEGHEQGYLTSDRIADALQDVELTPDQIDAVYNLFADLGIDILEGEDAAVGEGVEARPEEEIIAKLDLSVKTPTNGPVRMYLKEIGKVPLLTAEQEVSLAKRIERRDMGAKRKLIEANLRLVVSIAKRHVAVTDNFFELVSDGNMSLIRAVEKFDYARGNKFSTYASWAIMKNFARTIPDAHKQQDRFRTAQQEMFLATEDGRSDQYEQESSQLLRESQVGRILKRLDEREQQIIISRYGLDGRAEPLTLKEVGVEMGVTKERVRQLEARALDKLRRAAAEDRIDDPGE
jgi:RNA polymerase sigma factor (sigma-70 family)